VNAVGWIERAIAWHEARQADLGPADPMWLYHGGAIDAYREALTFLEQDAAIAATSRSAA
jgi:hypothetical protein